MKRNIIGLLALVALLPFSRSFAQKGEIIVTEFDPPLYYECDHVGGGSGITISMDINQDGVNDINITRDFSKGDYLIREYAVGSTRIRTVGLGGGSDTLAPGSNSVWKSEITLWDWDDTGDYHEQMGVRIIIDGEKYYGWFHQRGHSSYDFPFKKWVSIDRMAFCTIPDYPLRWGQTEISTGVDENSEGVFAVYPNPAKQSITLIGQQISEARLYRVTGQLVATKQGNGTESLTVDVSDLPSGLYFVAVIGEDGSRSVQKVVKE